MIQSDARLVHHLLQWASWARRNCPNSSGVPPAGMAANFSIASRTRGFVIDVLMVPFSRATASVYMWVHSLRPLAHFSVSSRSFSIGGDLQHRSPSLA
jgi:hypothetical protein